MALKRKWAAFDHLTSRQRHEAFFGIERILQELPLIGHIHLLDALPNCLGLHSHRDIYEFHFVESGTLGFRLKDSNFDVGPGSFFMTLPDELHGGVNELLEPSKCYWMHLHFPAGKRLPGLSMAESEELRRAFQKAPHRVSAASQTTRDGFVRLVNEHRTRHLHSELMARSLLHELLVSLARDLHIGSAKASATSEIAKAVRWINLHMDEPIGVADMARVAGLSESHFRQRFHHEMGFAPLDYVTRQRVARAKELLLQSTQSITAISLELGFNTSAYFASVFKRLTGQSPSDFRARVDKG